VHEGFKPTDSIRFGSVHPAEDDAPAKGIQPPHGRGKKAGKLFDNLVIPVIEKRHARTRRLPHATVALEFAGLQLARFQTWSKQFYGWADTKIVVRRKEQLVPGGPQPGDQLHWKTEQFVEMNQVRLLPGDEFQKTLFGLTRGPNVR
jgi:hypothetical protein